MLTPEELAERRREASRRSKAKNPQKAREATQRWREANPEKVQAAGRQQREADPQYCNEASKRSRAKNREKAREAARLRYLAEGKQRYASNAEARRKASKRWREANTEKVKQARRRWREANKEKIRERLQQWYAANKDAANAVSREWFQAHPAQARAYGAERRARVRQAKIGDSKEITAIYELARSRRAIRCAYCEKDTEPGDRHVDHAVPLVRGGAHSAENLVIACARCNTSKSRQTADEYRASLAYKTKSSTTR
jgi:5-methylcytosine-specific restriction endonuclease McrA